MAVTRIDLREARQQDENAPSKVAHIPVRGVVRSVQPEIETVKVEMYGEPGTTSMTVRHPFMGRNSWIRAMPEAGVKVVTQKIREPSQAEIWGYVDHHQGGLVKQAQDDSNNLIFRELRPGEIEVMTPQYAYQHFSEDGDLSALGGIVEHNLMQTELELTSRSPTYKRQLDQNDPTELAHEERFGLVKRADTEKPYSRQVYLKSGDQFQYEYGRWIRDDEGKDLINLHEGHLYDASQQPIKNSQTNKALRLRRYVAHRQQGDLTFDIDEELNMILRNTSKAKTTDLDFGPKNDVKVTSKKLDFSVVQSSTQKYGTSLTFRSPKVQVNSSSVGFGSAPSQPAVLGTALTTTILTPLISMMQSATSILAADTNLSGASQAALATLSVGLGSLSGSMSSVLSTEVRFTR